MCWIFEIKFNQTKAINTDYHRRKSATNESQAKNPPSKASVNNSNNLNNKKHPNHQKQGGNRAKNLLKFENDYDFEQANSKFEELRSQLSKLKVGDEAKPEQVSFFCSLILILLQQNYTAQLSINSLL